MTGWPERPDVGSRPVVWSGTEANGSVRPADPRPGDVWDFIDGRKYLWTGEDWVPAQLVRERGLYSYEPVQDGDA